MAAAATVRCLPAIFAALCVLASCDPDEPAEAMGTATPAALGPGWPLVLRFNEKLAAVGTASAAAGAGVPEACPDDRIRARLGSGAGRLLVMDADWLGARSAGGGETERYRFLTTPALESIPPPAAIETRSRATDAAYRIQQLEKDYPYLAVIRGTKRTAPRFEGDRFVSGEFEARVVIFDLSRATPLCASHVVVTSGEDVAALEGTPRERALWNDWLMRVRHALDDAVTRMSRHLRLDLG